jgi:regulator of protease activity HflC (stomatin/prohibitin superfamily)
VDENIASVVHAEMSALGVEVGAIALKDIILPGEMRAIMNQVVSAEKQAQANLIRRREETSRDPLAVEHGEAARGQPNPGALEGA